MKNPLSPLIVFVLAAMAASCAPVAQDQAQSAFAQGHYDEAANDITAALAHDPDNPVLMHLAAKIFTQRGVKEFQGGQMIAAGEDFQRAINYDPTYAMAYDYMGMLSFQQHNWQDAIKYGSAGAGYAGKPEPAYVKSARRNLRLIQSGKVAP
jgi:tetratricopeptide (TPR) repeat protein